MARFDNRIRHRNVIYRNVVSCNEAQTIPSTRFRSYREVGTWQPLVANPTSHTMQVSYVMTHKDYLPFGRQLNEFHDDRFPYLVPEYYLGIECDWDDDELTFADVPWVVEQNSYALIITRFLVYAVKVGGSFTSEGRRHVAISDFHEGIGSGIFIPLRQAALRSPTSIATNLKSVTVNAEYEFKVPRDYRQATRDYTTREMGNPKVAINRNIALPDSQLNHRRVRGRRGFDADTLVGFDYDWGNNFGGTEEGIFIASKDSTFTATFSGSLRRRYDYVFKHIVSKALLSASLMSLPDDDLRWFDAMIVDDGWNVDYQRYRFSASVNYARANIAAPLVGWGYDWGNNYGG